MKSLVFLSLAFDAMTFNILSKAELVKLTAEQKAAYDKLLAEFVQWFKTNHPNGMIVELPMSKLGTVYGALESDGSVTPKATITVITEGQPAWVPAIHNLKIGQLDVLAQATGIPSYQMLAVMTATKLRKGSLKMTLNLKVEGEKVRDRAGNERVISKTHVSQDDLAIILSKEVAESVERASAKAQEDLMKQFMTKTISASGAPVVVAATDEDVNP